MHFDITRLCNTSREALLNPVMTAIWDDFSSGVTIVDASGFCVYMNAIQQKHDGFSQLAVIGQHITSLYMQHELEPIPTIECLYSGKPILKKSNWYRTMNNHLASTINDFFPLFDKGKKDGAIIFTNWLDVSSLAKNRPQLNDEVAKTGFSELYTFDSFLGKNPSLATAIAEAKVAAKTSSFVMIWGESGTGKEIFAQAIHAQSTRSEQPFIPINCAAIPENLLEGLLFGTMKGAYTDSTDQAGLFEQASGGTLLLDELNSMSLGLQSKLLRVIQEKNVRRLGSHTEIPVDVRIISILNENPLRAMALGALRQDLFYRLAVVGIAVPPLRDRKDDILFLTREFIDRSEMSSQPCSIGISDEVINMFQAYDWPGNVRELLHVIEGSLVLLGTGTTINIDFLPRHFKELFEEYSTQNYHSTKENETLSLDYVPTPNIQMKERDNSYFDYKKIKRSDTVSLKDCLQKYEKECIINVLRVSGGNVAKAARMLDITSAGLHYKIQSLSISNE